MCFFFFKQKTAYEMRISDWSSDVCSSDLIVAVPAPETFARDRCGQWHAVIQPVLQGDELFGLAAGSIEPPEGKELAHHELRIEAGKEPLQQVHRHFPGNLQPRRDARQKTGRASCRDRRGQYV